MYVIDGYNLLHALARQKDMLAAKADNARSRLIELLGHLARRESTPVRVYFDGTPDSVKPGELDWPGLSVKFCGEGEQSADREVRLFVENARQPHKLRVVSSDRAVASAARLSGAKTITSQDMAVKLAKLAAEGRTQRTGAAEKPTRGRVGKLEQEMLDEIGDEREFENDVLRELKEKRSTDEHR